MDSLLLDALAAKNKDRPPIWLLRQAGRYMPTYQTLKDHFGTDALFHQSDLITTITLTPILELGVDAAILFSDILMVLETLGFSWKIIEGKGPLLDKPLTSLASLQKREMEPLFFPLAQAIKNVKSLLRFPLIGFVGGPFTLACYLIEGKKVENLKKTREWFTSDPDSFKKLLALLSEITAEWLHLQIKAGVDAIQIFDTLAGELAKSEFTQFALPALRSTLNNIDPAIPRILYTRKSSEFAPSLATLPAQALSVDESVDMAELRKKIPLPIALQGNLDPNLLFESPKVIAKKVKELLISMKGDPAFIVNVGGGLLPTTPYNHVQFLIDTVKNGLSR